MTVLLALLLHVAPASEPARTYDGVDAAPAPATAPPVTPVTPVAPMTPAPLDTTSPKFTPGKGLSLHSTDGRFALNLSLRTGFQYTLLELQLDDFRLWKSAALRQGTDQLRVQLQMAF